MSEEHVLKAPMTPAVRARRMEMAAGLAKHTLTLDTAMIGAIAGIVAFFPDVGGRGLLGFALLCFLISIFGAYMLAWLATLGTDPAVEFDANERKQLVVCFILADGGFLLGVSAVALSVWLNLIW